MPTAFRWEDLPEKEQLKNLVIDGIIIVKWIFKKWNRESLTGSTWLRIGTWRALAKAVIKHRVP